MDRAMVALVNPGGKLVGKSAVQDRATTLVEDFIFTLEATPLFNKVIRKKQNIWSKKEVHGPMANELLAKFQVMLGTSDFLAGPLMILNKPIGIYYADRQITLQKLGLAEFSAFKAVVDRANEILVNFGG
jgi:hypothetical protein